MKRLKRLLYSEEQPWRDLRHIAINITHPLRRWLRMRWEKLADPRSLHQWRLRSHVQQGVKGGTALYRGVCEVRRCGWQGRPRPDREQAIRDAAFHAGREHLF